MDTQTSRTERLKMALVADGYDIDSAPLAGALRMARELERELAEAREWQTSCNKAVTKWHQAEEQRDRLAEALQYVMQDLEIELSSRGQRDEQWSSLITAREALAAVEGGKP